MVNKKGNDDFDYENWRKELAPDKEKERTQSDIKKENKQKEVKKITLGLVLSWIFGIIFGLVGFISLIIGDILSFFCFSLASFVLFPPTNKFMRKKFNLELSKGVKIILVIVLIGISFSVHNSNESLKESYDNPNVLITKIPSEILPDRSDLSTEWVFHDQEDETDDFNGFESGKSISFYKGADGTYRVKSYVYKFSSVENTKDYYDFVIEDDNTLNKGGYNLINTQKIKAECTGYERDVSFLTKYTLYCKKNNIFFKVTMDSMSYSGKGYVIDIGKIISEKIS